MTAPLPTDAGPTHVRRIAPGVGNVTFIARGAVGVPTTIALDHADGAPAPNLLVARTLNRYDARLFSPVTVHVRAPVVTQVRPPGEAVTMYRVIVALPLLSGGNHDTTAARLRGLDVTASGAPGRLGANDAPTRSGTHDTSGFGKVCGLPDSCVDVIWRHTPVWITASDPQSALAGGENVRDATTRMKT